MDAGTVFDDIASGSLAGLNTGNIVEVSGFVDASGTIRATRIKFESDQFEQGTTEIEVKGSISNLDTGAMTFLLGDLTVDYSDAELPQSGLSDGLAVEVHSTQGYDMNNVLIASKIQVEDTSLGEKEGEKVEVEGFVTDFISESDFEVNGQRVQTDSLTQYEGGIATDIALNVKLEVKGTIIAGNILLADKIGIENESESEGESGSSSDN